MSPMSFSTWSHNTVSVEATRALGETIGRWIDTGFVMALTGDLGSGKTAFVQGLAKGLNVPPEYYITSPTYTLVNQYPGRLWLYHVDLYRMGDSSEADDIGLDELIAAEAVVAVEWAERLAHLKRHTHLVIAFAHTGENSRRIAFNSRHALGDKILHRLEKGAKRPK